MQKDIWKSKSPFLCPFYPISLPGVHYCNKNLSELAWSNVLFCFVRAEILARAPRGGRGGMYREGGEHLQCGHTGQGRGWVTSQAGWSRMVRDFIMLFCMVHNSNLMNCLLLECSIQYVHQILSILELSLNSFYPALALLLIRTAYEFTTIAQVLSSPNSPFPMLSQFVF